MKKALITIMVLILASASLFAAKEMFTPSFSTGFSPAVGGVSIGFHADYLFSASVTELDTVGLGTTFDFSLGLLPGSPYKKDFLFLFGPAYTRNTSPDVTLSIIAGPAFSSLEASDPYGYDDYGFGAGATVGFTFIPEEERKSLVQLGITAGATASVLCYYDTASLCFSLKGFVGFTTVNPLGWLFYDWYFSDLLDAFLDSY